MIVNQRGMVVYNSGSREETATDARNASFASQAKAKRKLSAAKIRNLAQELERTGVSIEEVKARYPFENADEMPDAVYQKVMLALAKTPDAAVA